MSDKIEVYQSKLGRPSDYTEQKATKICELLSSGMSLRKICEMDDMPERPAVFRWLSQHEAFRNQYSRAREDWAEAVFEEVLEISDDGTNDTYSDEDGKERTDWDVIARSKLRVDTRKWALARMSPKKYGEKFTQDVNVTNSDAKLSDEQIALRVEAIFKRALVRARQPALAAPDDVSDLV